MSVLLQDSMVNYVITLKDSDTMYITEYFKQTPEGIKFMECDEEIFVPYFDLQDVEKRVIKATSILDDILGS